MLNLWEHQNAVKALYSNCVGGICVQYGITRMELDILLFLANNPCFDTAKDIVEIRYLSKSQVSVSIKLLEQCGYIKKEYVKGNRKTAHLIICEPAYAIIADGKKAQEKFFSIVLRGFSQEEMKTMKEYTSRIWNNMDCYLKEEAELCINC